MHLVGFHYLLFFINSMPFRLSHLRGFFFSFGAYCWCGGDAVFLNWESVRTKGWIELPLTIDYMCAHRLLFSFFVFFFSFLAWFSLSSFESVWSSYVSGRQPTSFSRWINFFFRLPKKNLVQTQKNTKFNWKNNFLFFFLFAVKLPNTRFLRCWSISHPNGTLRIRSVRAYAHSFPKWN